MLRVKIEAEEETTENFKKENIWKALVGLTISWTFSAPLHFCARVQPLQN